MSGGLAQSLCLAFIFSVAIFLHILACALYNNWWPSLILVSYLVAPLPLCLYARAARSESLFDSGGGKAAQHWAEFTSTSILTLVVGIPFILWHVGVVEGGAALMDLAGFLLVCATAGLAALFARAEYGVALSSAPHVSVHVRAWVWFWAPLAYSLVYSHPEVVGLHGDESRERA